MNLRAGVYLSCVNRYALESYTSAGLMNTRFPSLVQNLFLNVFKEIGAGKMLIKTESLGNLSRCKVRFSNTNFLYLYRFFFKCFPSTFIFSFWSLKFSQEKAWQVVQSPL